jgi:signal transduction histidine kinase
MTVSSPPLELMPSDSELMRRYLELREYVALRDEEILEVPEIWAYVQPHVKSLVDDFYDTILQFPGAVSVIRGGPSQVERLKLTLTRWLEDLFTGNYDAEFVRNRWYVGWRHVKIGLSQIWTATAMSRMRDRLLAAMADHWSGSLSEFARISSTVTRLMDLDLALIQDAYHAEAVAKHLQGERELNEAIIGTTQSIVIEVDSDGGIRRGNTYLSRLVCGNDELAPSIKNVDVLIPLEERPKIRDLLSRNCDPIPCGPVITKLIDAGGRHRTIRWFARTIEAQMSVRTQPSELLHLLVGHDVTDLSEAQRRIVQHERLAAIGQTMAGLAHESRNAFQRSQAALETLALELDDRPDAVQLLGRIQRANDHLLHLYEEVLQFAKPVRLDLKRFDLRDIAEMTCKHVAQATQCDESRFQVQGSQQLPPIVADAFAVEQILRNLIENALVVSPPNKCVQIDIHADWQGDQSALRVEVKDEGPGISEENLDRVFEPFFSTRSRGTGLGLPIARRLAEAHGGSLELKTGPSGTTAILMLPEISGGDVTADPENVPDHRRQSR